MVQNSQLINRSVVRYSNALYSLSVDKKIQNKMYEECKSLLRTFSENPNFSTIFKSQLLNKKKTNFSSFKNLFREKREKTTY